MSIHILSEAVIAQIAAGEVVERPASVVKELLENAIDAGAKQIAIRTQGDGQALLQISDDGHGIRSSDVRLAFARHATSKLDSADDLYAIDTLGFRGEALASIAAVSKLTMTTRHTSDHSGTLIQLEGGLIVQERAIGSPVGTTITVEQLFFNMPARRKFLKKAATEKRQIATVVTRYAMAYPAVRFILEQDDREVFRTSGSGSFMDAVTAVMGADDARTMIGVLGDRPGATVTGVTSSPQLHRADRSRITLFVNGRYIQDSAITHAVVQAYHTILMSGRYPVAVLLIRVPSDQVDVNVHPTKAEVRFRSPEGVFSAVQQAVRSAVTTQADAASFRRSQTYADTVDNAWTRGHQLDMGLITNDIGQHARHRAELNVNDDYELTSPSTLIEDDTAIPEGAGAPARPRTLPILRVVGQIAASYIIAEGPAGMYLIDQHAAHERILYEQFMAAAAAQTIVKQMTLNAQTIELTPDATALVDEYLATLLAIGFDIEQFGGHTAVIRAVPAVLADHDPVAVVKAVLQDLERGDAPGTKAIEEKIVKRVCKTAAVKAGQLLNAEQMRGLITQLERCHFPLTCPHGRPTMIHMSSTQLEREFGRLGAG